MREIHATNVYNSLHVMSTKLVLNFLHILVYIYHFEYYDCSLFIDEETEEKKLRLLPKVPELTDGPSPAPEIIRMAIETAF